MKFSVTYYLNDEEGSGHEFNSTVSFYKHPNDYGNGYGMYIKSPVEPFGGSSYDIRYDPAFDPECAILYVVQFYTARYTGKDGSWKLTGIRVQEES